MTPSATTCCRCCSPRATRTARRCRDAGAARRADDAAGRRPRDDGLRAGLGRSSASPRSPAVLARLAAEIDSDDGDEYLTATVQETLRRRPVLPNTAPRLVKQPVNIGGWDYPPGVCVVANAYLVHHDPEIYPDPYAFRPERFLEEQPGHLHVDPVRGRPPPLPRRQFRAGRDEDRAASDAVALRGATRDRRRGGEPAAGDHGEPEPARHDRPARPTRGAWQRAGEQGRRRARGYDGLSRASTLEIRRGSPISTIRMPPRNASGECPPGGRSARNSSIAGLTTARS